MRKREREREIDLQEDLLWNWIGSVIMKAKKPCEPESQGSPWPKSRAESEG
jgi:hypothetical protein